MLLCVSRGVDLGPKIPQSFGVHFAIGGVGRMVGVCFMPPLCRGDFVTFYLSAVALIVTDTVRACCDLPLFCWLAFCFIISVVVRLLLLPLRRITHGKENF